jgi:hypothetical protein
MRTATQVRRLLLCFLFTLGACGEAPASDPPPGGPNDATILLEYLAENPGLGDAHHKWHSETLRSRPDYGIGFLTFHRGFVRHYDEWRLAHGYAVVVPWDPGTPIPADVPHPGRKTEDPSAEDPLCRRPVWLTAEGGADGARDPDFGASKLAEFTSSNQLGRSIDSPTSPRWHLRVHDTVGGDFGHPTKLVLDPIFWRWHKFVDDIWAEYQRLLPDGA